MKLTQLDKVLLDSAGEEFADKATIRQVLHTAANTLLQDGQQRPEDKYKLGMVAVKLKKAQRSVILTSEEVTLLKARVGLLFSPIVVLRVEDILEGRKPAEARILDEIDQEEVEADERGTK